MGQHINFEAKTDRELLVITAQTTNHILDRLDILNGTVRQHSTDIAKLKTKSSCVDERKPNRFVNALGRSGIIAIIAALIGGILYAFGNGIGWW